MSPSIENQKFQQIILVGNPNTGKSLFFSKLTKQKAASANYSGTTQTLKSCSLKINEKNYQIIDLPGIYDLDTTLPEEIITVNYLNSFCKSSGALILFFLDATRLEQGIYLLSQILEDNKSLVVLLTQYDIATKKNLEIDYQKLAEKLAVKIIPTSNLHDSSLKILNQALADFTPKTTPEASDSCTRCTSCNFQERHQIARQIKNEISSREVSSIWSDRLDQILLDPLYGTLSFLLITFTFFWLIFFMASWPMDLIDQAFAFLSSKLTLILPSGLLTDLLLNGIIPGLNGVIIFLPQIFILFFLINLLDNSGYLARMVCIMDRYLRKFGLSGTAFLPILSAHACAIPAILGTKVIKNKHERFLTIFIIPFFSCSARLPVYVMLTALMFPKSPLLAAAVFVACYLSGAIIAFLTALIIKKVFISTPTTHLLLELPAYRIPPLKLAWQEAGWQSFGFIKKAGTFILGFSVVIWALSTFPNPEIEKSYLAIIGNFVQPIFEPLGFDWRITVGILTSFAAREVIVSTLAIIFAGGSDSVELTTRLQQATLPNGDLLFNLGTIASLLVFFIFALQCFPTSVAAWKETGSKTFAITQLLYASAIAYLLAWVVGRILS